MNKETLSYIRHIMGSDFVQIDIFNAMLALAIIVVSLCAFITGNMSMFGISFVLGAILALFNMIKSIMKKTPLGALIFGILVPTLASVAVYIFDKVRL